VRALSSADVLETWERGSALVPAGRMLELLRLASPGEAPDALAELPLGECNRRLLAVHGAAFGPRLEAVTACPGCGERLELELPAAALAAAGADGAPAEVRVEAEGHQVACRPLVAADLVAAAAYADVASARGALVRRCVRAATRGGDGVPAEALPEVVVEAVGRALLESDPGAELLLELVCPACEKRWEAPLEPAEFVWAELRAGAERLLWEVHSLARAYGWTEPQVLALSAPRRRAYLELAGA